ncbi:MAG: leucine--tRNA ligase, partial [Ruminococcus sp.]|nr:leucine--tRNA ligase [Ruminococcus sp.]
TQRNWIGRSTGAEVTFRIDGYPEGLKIYTTRPDTMFGATYMVVAPEHPLVDTLKDRIENMDEVLAYREQAAHKSDFERSELAKEKTGVPLKGVYAINPCTDEPIPVWISDYVLMGYGTGAIMAVPGHDTRDWEFARKFGLPVIEVVAGGDIEKEAFTDCETGVMVNSGFLNGMQVEEAKKAIVEFLENKGIGHKKTNFKLRDWLFSRQRYWGEPIPLVYCEHCGWVPIPEDQLPLTLPEIDNYKPADDGSSALARATDWIHTTCPKCGAPAEREIDTMPNWAGSSWYFLRYCDPHNDKEFASKEALEYWMPVDWYNGGMEHVTRHMIYSRFWHKFLYDLGLVNTSEPYAKRTAQGLILGTDGEKMSKSRGNVVDPNDVVKQYGADVLRLYVLFMGDYEKAAPWSENSVKGCKRFVDRVWGLQDKLTDSDDYSDALRSNMHKTIKKVSEDIEAMKFNTAIAAMMTLLNDMYNAGSVTRREFRDFLIILYPFAPHITEELYEVCGFGGVLSEQEWVSWDEALCVDATVEIVCQINGKIKCKLNIPKDSSKDEMIALAKEQAEIADAMAGKSVVKEIAVPGKLVNIVVK